MVGLCIYSSSSAHNSMMYADLSRQQVVGLAFSRLTPNLSPAFYFKRDNNKNDWQKYMHAIFVIKIQVRFTSNKEPQIVTVCFIIILTFYISYLVCCTENPVLTKCAMFVT